VVSDPICTASTAKLTMIPRKTSELNSMQSTQLKNPHQFGGKNKNKSKSMNPFVDLGTQQPLDLFIGGNKGMCKVKYPCMTCGKYHFTKDFAHLAKVQQYVKGQASQLVVLKNPFPPQ
jgi:hypothetical protein